MKKQELPSRLTKELLDALFGFCYARTRDSSEAEELCSDITLALVKAARTEGEIRDLYPFIWRTARNVYADFSRERKARAERFCAEDATALLAETADDEADGEDGDDARERLSAVFERISYLTRAYRETMILFYIEGCPSAEIAKRMGVAEGTVRQRLFSARQKIRNEVEEMSEKMNAPISLRKMDFEIWGNGDPTTGDPRSVCTRLLSKHIVWLCRKQPMSAEKIAEALHVPTVYVEEELEILRKGENGKYGMLRLTENGKYTLNFVLLEKDALEKMQAIYRAQIPKICETICDFIAAHERELCDFPYLNRKKDKNLILWQQIPTMGYAFSDAVQKILAERYFAEIPTNQRPFRIFGYAGDALGQEGIGWDSIYADHICGWSHIKAENIYFSALRKHFACGHNIAHDPELQFALRAIDGLPVESLSETEKEHAAGAIECGYLEREDGILYTKILVCSTKDREALFDRSAALRNGCFDAEAETAARDLAALIRKTLPELLLADWDLVNQLADLPVVNAVIGNLVERGVLTLPEGGVGAEGCFLSVEKE